MEVDTNSPQQAVGPSGVELVPSTMDEEIRQVVDMFWGQTEALAEQNAHLNRQQAIQANNQTAALLAVHANAEQGVNRLAAHTTEAVIHMEQGVNRLAAHQQEVVAQMERMLQDTRKAMHEQIHAIAHDQTVQADEKIQNVLLEAVAARQLALQHAADAQRVENNMSTALSRMQAELSQRIDEARASPSAAPSTQLEERFLQLKNELAAQITTVTGEIVGKSLADVERRLQAKGPVSTRVQRVVDESIKASEKRVEEAMQLALQLHRDDMNTKMQQQTAQLRAASEIAVKQCVDDATADVEQRIEERMRNALRESRTDLSNQIKHHADEQQRMKMELASRIDGLSGRIATLEQASSRAPTGVVDSAADATTIPLDISELETASTRKPAVSFGPRAVSAKASTEGVQREMAMAITEATRKIKLALDLYEKSAKSTNDRTTHRRQQQLNQQVSGRLRRIESRARPAPSSHSSSKIAAIVSKLQKDVSRRAEAAAKNYETNK